MNTTAYLTRQGWLGAGYSLHPSGHGIQKPLLVSKKSNVLGIGKKKHDAHADQWWARAFDATLKDLNVSKDEVSGETEKVTFGAGARQLETAGRIHGKWAGLYGDFVKGPGLEGTFTREYVKGKEGYEEVGVLGKRKRFEEEQDEWGQKKTSTGNGMQLLGFSSVTSSPEIPSVEHYQNEDGLEQEKVMEVEHGGDTVATKLAKNARRKSRAERRLRKTQKLEAASVSVDTAIKLRPARKKKRKNKATDAGEYRKSLLEALHTST